MGLLSASPSSAAVGSSVADAAVDKAKPSTTDDGAFEAPNRNARAHCWQARDAFFECLERNSIIDSIKDAETAQRQCGEQSKLFEKECARSWVIYFKQRRVMEFNKQKTLEKLRNEGVKGVPKDIAPPPPPPPPPPPGIQRKST